MNIKRFVLAFLAVFIFMFAYSGLLHGTILERLYLENQNIWRPQADMQQHFWPWLVGGEALQALVITLIFAKGRKTEGVGEGFRYGILVGLWYVGAAFISFATQLLPKKLILGWGIGWIVEFLFVGFILGWIYKPTATGATAAPAKPAPGPAPASAPSSTPAKPAT